MKFSAHGYLFAILAVCLAVLLRVIAPGILSETPYLAFYPAIVAAAIGGTGPGILATVVAFLCVDLLFDATPAYIRLNDPTVLGRMVIFLASGIGVSIIAGQLRAAKVRLSHFANQLQERVTERSAELLEKSRHLDALFDHAITPLVLLDRHFNFIRVNQAYARACNRNIADFPGHNHFEFYPHAENQAIFENVVQTGKPYVATAKPFEFPDHPEWGTTYWNWKLVPVADRTGEVELLFFSLEDVTATKHAELELSQHHELLEKLVSQRTQDLAAANARLQDEIADRKLAEQAVKASEQQLQAIMEHLTEGVVVFNMNEQPVLWNQIGLQMHGFSRHDEVCQTMMEFAQLVETTELDGTVLPLEQWPLKRLLRGEMVRKREVQIRRLDRNWTRILRYSGTQIRDSDGRPHLVVATVSDITRQKQAENALRESERRHREIARELARAKETAEAANAAKDNFLAVLSHELRTPLTPVLLTISEMQADKTLSPPIPQNLNLIRHNVELEVRLINDLLDISRITHGKLELRTEELDAHERLRWALDISAQNAREKKLDIQCNLTASESTVQADGARLQQIIWNLIKNAIKFTPVGGEIRVRSWNPQPRQLCIEVADNGVGIEPENLPKVFDAFEQGDPRISRQFGGLGLGLAISKALAELHHGTLTASSPGKGQGATFTLELPTITRTYAQPTEEHVTPRGGQLRIMLVEDHAITAKVIARLLSKEGYQMKVASNVRSALALIDTFKCDLLISDIGLPDGTGIDIITHLHRVRPEVPAIALTGFGMESDIEQFRAAGFTEHLTKPIDINQLLAAIARVTPLNITAS